MDIWTRIETQLNCATSGIERSRLLVAILCWRVYDLVSFGMQIAMLVAVFRMFGDTSLIVDLILLLMVRSLLRPVAWLLLPTRPQYR